MARVARRAGARARDREPAHDRQALRHARPDRRARSAGGTRLRACLERVWDTAGRAARSAHRRVPRAAGARARAAHPRRTRGARATGSTSRSRGAARTTAGLDEFYGRAMPAGIADRRGGVRPAVTALRAVRRGRLGGRHAAVRRRGLVVGDEPRPGDRALARRPRLVPRARGAASASACASGRSRT